MSVPNKRFREGDVYFKDDFEKVMFFYDSNKGKFYRKFEGDENQTKIPHDDNMMNMAIRTGNEIDKSEWEGKKGVQIKK